MRPPDRGYLVLELYFGRATVVGLEIAACIAGIDTAELLDAIDEDGVFDNGRIIVVDYAKPADIYPRRGLPLPAPRGGC